MSRIAARRCGAVTNGAPAKLQPLNGWYWPFAGGLSPATVVPFNTAGTQERTRPVSLSMRQFKKLFWNIQSLLVEFSYDDGALSGSGNFLLNRYYLKRGEIEARRDDSEAALTDAASIPHETAGHISLFYGQSGDVGDDYCYVYFDHSQIVQGLSSMDLCMALSLSSSYVFTFHPGGPEDVDFPCSGSQTFLGNEMPMSALSSTMEATVTVTPYRWFSYRGLFDEVTGRYQGNGRLTLGL